MTDHPAAAHPDNGPEFLPPGQLPRTPSWDPVEDYLTSRRYGAEPAPEAPGGLATPPGHGIAEGYSHPLPLDATDSAAPVGATSRSAVPSENIQRGIAFSLLGILIGAIASALIYQAGYMASITSLLMAVAAGWLYAKGAGAPPRAGAVALVVVIVAGVAISLLAMLGLELYNEIAAEWPGAGFADIMPVVLDNLFYPPVWSAFAADALIFVAFAALGTFGVLRRLSRASSDA